MDGFPSDGFVTTTILARLMPFGAPSTPSFADGAANGSNRPCVDGPPLARVFERLCNAGWCGHVSDLFARHTEPLATMPSAYQVPTKSSHSRCWVDMGSPDRAVSTGLLH